MLSNHVRRQWRPLQPELTLSQRAQDEEEEEEPDEEEEEEEEEPEDDELQVRSRSDEDRGVPRSIPAFGGWSYLPLE